MKKFTVEYELGEWKALFEVDVAKAAPLCRAQLEQHYSSSCAPDEDSDEAAVEAYLKACAPSLIRLSVDYSITELRNHSNLPEHILPMDGSFGISLMECDEWVFERACFDVITD